MIESRSRALISSLPSGKEINVRYVRYSDPINEVLRSIEIDHKWFILSVAH